MKVGHSVGLIAGLTLAGTLATGCTSGSSATPPLSTTSAPAPSAEPTLPSLPAVRPWSAAKQELHPGVKEAATAYIEAAGTWDNGAGSASAVVKRVRAIGLSGEVGKDAARLADDGAAASSLRVIFPQLGGLTGTSASVMLLAEQTLLSDDGESRTREMIFDVRLSRSGARATVTGIEPPVVRNTGGSLSRAAKAVLANDNIVLHAPAVADIRSGDTQDSVLEVLDTLAQHHKLEILTLHTGHPHNVYATDRTSNHTEGRAADIWQVDGRPVVRAPHALLVRVLTAAGAAGATEVGGPFDLNAGGPGYFTDDVHSDHIHVGVSPGRQPARP